uniref:Uncharacterized protein n=1 Tax=Panagrolaimus sp. PS1159 TaxID=55785 RepID=A0AC35F5C1_9BILA
MYPEIRSTIVVDERGIPVRETDFPPRPRRSENEPEPLYVRRARRVRYCPILDETHRPVVIQASQNETGRCIISADQAVHYCGFSEEVSAPPIPPPETGRCHLSPLSGREICYPEYEALDTSCTDVRSDQGSGLVAPPVVKHATVRAMAFVPPDNLRRLIRQYYRQLGKPIPADTKFSPQSFLFVKYKCEFGYEFVDEIDTMYCQNKQWVLTPPVCRGKGPCEQDNGGCSHSCLSFDNRTVECRCPKGFILDTDKKTCIKPVPKNLCRNLAGCRCTALDDVQFSCTCTGTAEKCLLLKGPPKIYLTPNPPFSAIPGGSINITCQAVGYPFPTITWRKEGEDDHDIEHRRGAYRSEQVLMVKEVYKNSKFVCVAKNDEGSTERAVEVTVLGPGSAPILKTANAGRTSIQISWDPPHLQNRPIISYTLYYTTNPQQPLKFWKKLHVNEPQRQVTIPHLTPHKQYFIRVRALDKEGPGKPSSTVSVSTLKPPKIPTIEIVDGAEKLIAPNTSFAVSCNVTDSDPTPSLYWASRGRPITQQKTTKLFTIQHNGLIEDAVFTCTAKNEAGTDEKNVSILIAGPSMPERIRYNVDGTSVQVFWEKPKYENSVIKDYEILYTKDPSLPLNEWQSSKVGDPAANTFTVSGLDEKTPYSFKIRGISDRGPGQPSLGFDIQTWLGPREPEVTLNPSEPIVSRPSTAELVFNCDATGVPKPKIIWLSNGIPIEDGKEDYRIYEVKVDNLLDKTSSKLTSQSTTKSGPITCQAINKHGQDEKRVDVKILGPGSPPKNIKSSTQENGFTVEWEPPTHPNGPISKYVIYYTPEDSDAELADYNTKVVDGSDTSVTIGNQNEDTPFIIRMQAISDDGPGIISETYKVKTGQKHIPLLVRLEVIDPPTVEGEETVVEPKQVITFRCVAEGRPGPTVSYTWLPLNNTESGEEPVAISTNPSANVEHRYETDSVTSATSTRRKLLCQARNQDGTREDSHVFNVKKPGSPPKEISPVVDIDNRVTIKWEKPDHPNGDITGYKVYLSADPAKPLDSWQVFDVPVAPEDEPKIEFGRGDLEPDTPYYVRIAAKNDDGEGVLSDPTGFETVSGAPIDSPTDTVVDIAEDNTVNLTWSGPKQPNGPLQGYTVYFTPSDPNTRDEDYKSWTKVDIPSTNDTGFVSLDNDVYNIIPNHEYKARITAKNDMNEGPPSVTTVFKTGSGELPPVITLTPDDNPFLIPPRSDVNIKCEATGVPMPKIKWIVGTEEHSTAQLRLTDIKKDVTATCIATNNAGEAQQIVDIQVQGPGTPPNEVVVLPMPNQEINVEWTAPDESNGPLKEYVIHYGEVPEGQREPTEWQTISVSPDAVREKITNVKPKANYAVKVQAVSDRGPGVQSSPIIVQTLPLAPVAPESADVIVHDNNTVVIQFDAVPNPENKTTNIKSYKILYTKEDPSLDTTNWKELIWNQPDDQPVIAVPIDGENFSPDTKYNVKVIPIGEIEGPSSDNVPFQTGDGIIPPDKPVINADLEDGNIVRVPAGSDYTVSCTSQGFPTPFVRWVDQEGNQLSEDGMLRVYDIKTHKKAKCIAENPGGVKETDFTIYVAGPGNAPENIRVSANHPRTIDVRWDPPTIPNGNITRYIIYYTPLDDQERAYQVGQVPKKPISEWMTYHVIGEHLNEGEKHARLTDFVDADTAYAIVIQAANDDGPGPYSIQHSIRTMSKAREAAPKDLRVDPLNQTSADASWKPPEPSDEALLGYELYFIEADKEIDEDDIISLPNFEKIAIDDPAQLKYKLIDMLKADTEYVFKIRAIYANGPGVFSEACITKTPPIGSPPYIVVSAGGHGVHGTTDIDLLPGSAFTVFCNASGDPQPTVKWIRGGSLAIDPSMVKSDDSAAEWSLKLTNLTEDTTFLCYAHNPLGHANWTINIKIDKAALPEGWNKDGVKARLDNGQQTLHFSDVIPENLKRPGDWIIHYTDDPTLPLDQWQKIPSDGTKLDKIVVPDLNPGTTYHVVVENPKEGVTSPEFVTTAPKPPYDLRVGTSINDETVIDFKPAVSSDDITEHMIRYWPADDEGEVNYVKIRPENITSGTIIDGLLPGKEYVFQPIAQVQGADDLVGDKLTAKMPTDDVECDCSHACTFTENAQGQREISCYCPEGYELAEDGKNCVEGITKEENEVVEIGPTIDGEQVKPEEVTPTTEGIPGEAITIPTEAIQTVPTLRSEESLFPTDFRGATVIVEQAETEITPTDGQGREIKPIVTIDGKLLPTDDYGTTFNQIGQPVDKDEFGIPLDPT